MFGWGELGIIAILAIILLGPDKLPEVFKTLGKIYGEYKKAKRRFELELIYGYEIPSRELIDELVKKRMDELGVNEFNFSDTKEKTLK